MSATASIARTVERNGEVIGAIFPGHFTLRIARVPYRDPDRDGAVNGHTHTIRWDVDGAALDRIEPVLNTPHDGHNGSKKHLAQLIARAVQEWNADK